MSLPRIFIEVSDAPSGGWAVQVSAAEDDHKLAPYGMDSTTVTLGDRDVRVPVVPPSRRPGGTAEHRALGSGDTAAISAMLGRLASGRTRQNDVRVYGRWLFECLLAPAWPEIRDYLAVKVAKSVELALCWSDSQADLHSQAWEAMYYDQTPLVGLPDMLVVVTRVVQSSYEPPPTITGVPRVLFATGAALTDDVIRPGAMFMGLLRKFDADGICVTHAANNVSLSDLEAKCREFKPDVVHLVAHGEMVGGETVLQLGGKDPGFWVNAGQLRQALTAGGRPMAVVLSACHSGGGPTLTAPPTAGTAADGADDASTWRPAPMAAELVAGGIAIVTAMAGAVSEPACRLYTTRLVDAIHRGLPLGQAAAEGRAAALTGTPTPSRQLDWAMPTIFLASKVKPEFRPLNPASVNKLVGIAESLELRQNPIFIGRQNILSKVDDLFSPDPDRRTGFLVIARDGPLDQLGSTRLLREIGFRLLRTGHVPLLLADHADTGFGSAASGIPRSLRAFLAEVLQQAVQVTMEFSLPPPRLRSLQADESLVQAEAVTGASLAGQDLSYAYEKALGAVHAFAGNTGELGNLRLIQFRLAEDLAELAGIMAGAGEPFGPDTRVVVLADQVHEWTDALQPLVKMIGGHGFGSASKPTPVIVTASLSGVGGSNLAGVNFSIPGVRYLELTTLSNEEATVGFQWVLLNPWTSADARTRLVYVAARTTRQFEAQNYMSTMNGKPEAVTNGLLYNAAELLALAGKFVDHDDEAVFDRYVELHQ